MFKVINQQENQILNDNGLEIFGQRRIPLDLCFEGPSGVKACNLEQQVTIGAYSYAVSGFLFGVEIGRYCSIGESVQIGRQDHPTNWLTTSPYTYMKGKDVTSSASNFENEVLTELPDYDEPATSLKRTIIEHDVWIGHGAFIKPGIKIGTGAIVAAQAVVVKDVEPYSIVGGNPAKHIKYRFDDNTITKLLCSKWWNLTPKQLAEFKLNKIEDCLDELSNIAKKAPNEAIYKKVGDLI